VVTRVPTEHARLDLDRVLVAMRCLRGEEVVAVAPGQRLEEIDVHRGGPERRVVGLEGRREGIGHPRVARAENDEEIRVGTLDEGTIGPAVSRPAAVEVDMPGDEPAKLRCTVT